MKFENVNDLKNVNNEETPPPETTTTKKKAGRPKKPCAKCGAEQFVVFGGEPLCTECFKAATAMDPAPAPAPAPAPTPAPAAPPVVVESKALPVLDTAALALAVPCLAPDAPGPMPDVEVTVAAVGNYLMFLHPLSSSYTGVLAALGTVPDGTPILMRDGGNPPIALSPGWRFTVVQSFAYWGKPGKDGITDLVFEDPGRGSPLKRQVETLSIILDRGEPYAAIIQWRGPKSAAGLVMASAVQACSVEEGLPWANANPAEKELRAALLRVPAPLRCWGELKTRQRESSSGFTYTEASATPKTGRIEDAAAVLRWLSGVGANEMNRHAGYFELRVHDLKKQKAQE
jgi:hypothetical protein